MTDFPSLGLSEPILRAVAEAGYDAPTPIQAQAIPQIMQGRDLLGLAQTGTGKTAAFTLPLLHALSRVKGRPAPKSCRALILAPTRELAAQINDNLRAYATHLRVSSTVVVGGVKPGPQVRALSRGVDVLIATPGRLEDHLRGGAVSLKETHAVVLDEADQMLDLGFFPAIRRILGQTPSERQTLLFSATMPRDIRKLADDFLSDPAEVSVTPAAKPADRVEQHVRFATRPDKRDALVEILAGRDVSSAIVFTRTKRGADRVAKQLVASGLKAAAIHGDKSQGQRQRALGAFKNGSAPILVATDIAARGIDVDGVSHVVNYELPEVAEAYVHRIGRTARAGRDGVAITLCAPEERDLLRAIEKLIKRDLPKTGVDLAPPPSEKKPAPRGRRNGARPGGTPAPGARRRRNRGPRSAQTHTS